MKFNQNISNMVKGIAIVFMLMHHLFGCATAFCEKYKMIAEPVNASTLYNFSMNAKVCVGMFVFITAFGITRQYNKKMQELGCSILDKKQVEKFSLNRYKKLIFNFGVIYLLTILTSFMRQGGLGGVYNKEGIKKAIMYGIFDGLGMADYFRTPSLNETWWYMPFAVFMIFLIPGMIKCYKENGIALIIICGLIYYFGSGNILFVQYFLGISIGIFCAEENVLEKIYDFCIFENEIVRFISKVMIYGLVLIFLFWFRGKITYTYLIDPIFTVFVSALSMEVYSRFKIVSKFLESLGRHSMNIFLVHTLIFEYYFTGFIYGFRYWWLILAALLVSSWVTSVIVEMLKKKIIILFHLCLKRKNRS